MITEQDKYSECYKLKTYKLQGARLQRVMVDNDGLEPGTTYLDVGCGRGELVHAALRRGVKAKGLELVPYLCDGEKIINGNLSKLPFRKNEFDTVSCYDVIEHLPTAEVDQALSELFRVAKKRLILTTNNKASTYQGMDLHLTRKPRDWWQAKLEKRAESVSFSGYGRDEWHFDCVIKPSAIKPKQ